MRFLPVAVLGLTLGASCRCIIGNLTECQSTPDCSALHGSGLTCVEGLCVHKEPEPLDARCRLLTAQSDGGVVRLGSVMPRTNANGSTNQSGVAREQALLLAADQLNPPLRQGINGRSIELIGCDSQSSSTTAGELAKHLIERGAIAILSSGSSETISVARVTVPSGVLQVSVAATAPEITDLVDRPPGVSADEPGLVWRTSSSDTHQARVIASNLTDGGTPKTALLVVNDAYGQGLSLAFSRHYPASAHGTFLYDRDGDVEAALNKAAAFAPEQLLIVAFPGDAVRLVNGSQSRPELAGRPLFFTDAAKSPALFIGLTRPEALMGARGTAPSAAPLPSEARAYFVTQYSQRFGGDPLLINATANAFDAMMCVALAAWAAKDELRGPALARMMARLYQPGALQVPLTPTSFNTAISELDNGRALDVSGASGPLDFDSHTGEAPGPIEIWKVDGNPQSASYTFATVEVIGP